MTKKKLGALVKDYKRSRKREESGRNKINKGL